MIAHDHVERDRHLEILHRLPEPGERGVVEVTAAPGRDVRREEHAHAPLRAGAQRLRDRALGVQQGDVRDRVQASVTWPSQQMPIVG